MSAEAESCIVCQFSHYASLNAREVELLASLEKTERRLAAGSSIRNSGEPAAEFYTLKSGWAIAEQNLEDGQRQVIDVFVPGQVLGLREIAYNTGLCNFTSLTDTVICPFPKGRIIEIFDESRHLTDLFFLILAREQATLVERVINLGRRSALEKVAHFLLEMYERLCIANPAMESSYTLPMTQQCMGDTLGLSSVHVSRSMSKLSNQNLIVRDGYHVSLTDTERLRRLAGFHSGYLDIDTSWVRNR